MGIREVVLRSEQRLFLSSDKLKKEKLQAMKETGLYTPESFTVEMAENLEKERRRLQLEVCEVGHFLFLLLLLHSSVLKVRDSQALPSLLLDPQLYHVLRLCFSSFKNNVDFFVTRFESASLSYCDGCVNDNSISFVLH